MLTMMMAIAVGEQCVAIAVSVVFAALMLLFFLSRREIRYYGEWMSSSLDTAAAKMTHIEKRAMGLGLRTHEALKLMLSDIQIFNHEQDEMWLVRRVCDTASKYFEARCRESPAFSVEDLKKHLRFIMNTLKYRLETDTSEEDRRVVRTLMKLRDFEQRVRQELLVTLGVFHK